MRLLKLLLIFLVCVIGPAEAGPIEDAAIAAIKRGDYATGLRLFRSLAEKGDAAAQVEVGAMYEFGHGVLKDPFVAVSWYRKAAEQGYVRAQTNLGVMYDNGRGVPQNNALAISWYRKAADRGDARAQYNLGHMYGYPGRAETDWVAAVSWYRKAADQGHADAQFMLGKMYETGSEPADFAEAMKWYRKAADQGDAGAHLNLGIMYEHGKGTLPDLAEAMKLYRKAVDLGEPYARNWLQNLLKKTANTATISPPVRPAQGSASGSSILMKKVGGTYVVPVRINNAITLDFVVDSGASDVSIPEDVVTTLIRAGTIRETDFIGEKTYVLADGSKVKSPTFRIQSLKVGDRILENVIGSVASAKGSLLLGQSFLGRFRSWSIDNSKHALVLE